jgi:protein-S-isoprenylcysteine O-methyltransferase Ste14
MNYALFAVAFLSFLTYVVAVKFVFTDDNGAEVHTKIIKVCTVLFAVMHLWILWRHPIHSTGFAVMALICYLVGLILFFAARNALLVYRSTLSFTPDLPAWMLHKGIYSVIRHPFFLAFCFTWLGGALAVHYLRTSSTTIIMMALYWSAAKMQERKFENSSLAGEYRIYKRATGMFLPSLKLFR